MSNAAYTVRARWDEESKSWWTDGEDIPGLCCQADSFDELVETVGVVCSIDAYLRITYRDGWSAAAYKSWLRRMLTETIFHPPQAH